MDALISICKEAGGGVIIDLSSRVVTQDLLLDIEVA